MIVVDKREFTTVSFRCLKIGETFLNSKGELCQKICQLWDEDEESFNTVQLRNGMVSYTSDYDEVTQVAVTATYTDI